jgi:hypothetical protein
MVNYGDNEDNNEDSLVLMFSSLHVLPLPPPPPSHKELTPPPPTLVLAASSPLPPYD